MSDERIAALRVPLLETRDEIAEAIGGGMYGKR